MHTWHRRLRTLLQCDLPARETIQVPAESHSASAGSCGSLTQSAGWSAKPLLKNAIGGRLLVRQHAPRGSSNSSRRYDELMPRSIERWCVSCNTKGLRIMLRFTKSPAFAFLLPPRATSCCQQLYESCFLRSSSICLNMHWTWGSSCRLF